MGAQEDNDDDRSTLGDLEAEGSSDNGSEIHNIFKHIAYSDRLYVRKLLVECGLLSFRVARMSERERGRKAHGKEGDAALCGRLLGDAVAPKPWRILNNYLGPYMGVIGPTEISQRQACFPPHQHSWKTYDGKGELTWSHANP